MLKQELEAEAELGAARARAESQRAERLDLKTGDMGGIRDPIASQPHALDGAAARTADKHFALSSKALSART